MNNGLSAEEAYYRKHYEGGVRFGATDLRQFERDMFAPGGRYHLAVDGIRRTVSPSSLVVELGCGGGEALILLQRRHGIRRLIGLDIAAVAEVSPEIEFAAANLNTRWPLENGSVDYLLAMMVIEHLFDPFHAFQEIHRTLQPSGTAFVNLPLVTGLKNRLRLLAGRLPVTSSSVDTWFDKREWDGNHLHYFSIETLRRLASESGLVLERMAAVGRLYKLKEAFPSMLASEVTFSLRRG